MNLSVIKIDGNEIIITEELNQNLSKIASDKGISVEKLINQYIKEGLENAKI